MTAPCSECARVRAALLGEAGDGFAPGIGGLCAACLRARHEGHGQECVVALTFDLRRTRLPAWWLENPNPAAPGNPDPSAEG